MKVLANDNTFRKTLAWTSNLVLAVLVPILSVIYLEPGSPLSSAILFIIVAFFMFNIVNRKSLAFKNYFTHKYNPFTSRYEAEVHFDIPKTLMFEKVKEVLDDSPFKLAKADDQKCDILAVSSLSFKSWGENLYISFSQKENKTVMKVCSVTFFQALSWGKNKDNTQKLIRNIESSFTI